MVAMSEQRITELKTRLPAAVRRRQLLEVALARFAAHGYHDTSMEEIAEAAGVTKPVLYQHFSSKKKLYLEILDSVGRELVADVIQRAAAETDPYHRVLAGFRAYFHYACEHTSAYQLFFGSGARSSDDLDDSIRKVEDVVALIIAGFIDADIDTEHREMLGYALVGLGEVVGRRWVAVSGEPDGPGLYSAEADVLAGRLADLVWAGLRGLPGAADRSSTDG
jgi:AcrR family transcriptional regulator